MVTCWDKCFEKVVTDIVVVQLQHFHNASFAIVVLTRTDAFRRQRRMRDQLSRESVSSRPAFVTCDFEHLPVGCPGPCFDNRSAAAQEPSTVAIALTHVAVSSTLATFPAMRRALVMEDDIIVRPAALHAQLVRVTNALKETSGWHFVALGCSQYGNGRGKPLLSGMQPCSRMYLVSSAGMEKIARALPLADPIDNAMPKIFGVSNRKVYHTSQWPMRHGSHIHKIRRGGDF